MVFVKKNGRSSFRSNRRSSFIRSNNSNRPRVKGNITQLYDKYLKLAKEASSSDDRIQAEYYNQFADHYARLMAEQGLKTITYERTSNILNKNITDNSVQVNKEIDDKDNVDTEMNSPKSTNALDEINDDDNSIESVSFIAQSKKQTVKSKK